MAADDLVPPQYENAIFTSITIPMIKVRQSHDCLVLIMVIPIPGKMVFILKQAPCNIESQLSSSVGADHFFSEYSGLGTWKINDF